MPKETRTAGAWGCNARRGSAERDGDGRDFRVTCAEFKGAKIEVGRDEGPAAAVRLQAARRRRDQQRRGVAGVGEDEAVELEALELGEPRGGRRPVRPEEDERRALRFTERIDSLSFRCRCLGPRGRRRDELEQQRYRAVSRGRHAGEAAEHLPSPGAGGPRSDRGRTCGAPALEPQTSPPRHAAPPPQTPRCYAHSPPHFPGSPFRFADRVRTAERRFFAGAVTVFSASFGAAACFFTRMNRTMVAGRVGCRGEPRLKRKVYSRPAAALASGKRLFGPQQRLSSL